MFIQVEPTDFFMYAVKLFFDLEHPDSEDQAVRDYLAANELEPKYQGTGDLDGRQCEIMRFGGCYLGPHLERIARIQRRAVEVELLTAAIEHHLNSAGPDMFALSEDQRRTVIPLLVRGFHQEGSFGTGENGELIASLDGDAVRAAARRLLGGPVGEDQGVGITGMERAMGIEPT